MDHCTSRENLLTHMTGPAALELTPFLAGTKLQYSGSHSRSGHRGAASVSCQASRCLWKPPGPVSNRSVSASLIAQPIRLATLTANTPGAAVSSIQWLLIYNRAPRLAPGPLHCPKLRATLKHLSLPSPNAGRA